jgi:hypothetical protein
LNRGALCFMIVAALLPCLAEIPPAKGAVVCCCDSVLLRELWVCAVE